MTSYASDTDLLNGGIPTAAASRFTSPERSDALGKASRTADSYLRGRYTLPLASWDTDLTRAVVAIATYDLFSSKGFNPDSSDKNIRTRYEDAIKWLEGVRDSQIHPDIVDSTPDESDEAAAVYCDAPRGW